MILKINTDGASRGNPGPASFGFVIYAVDGVILHQEGGYIGTNTNNVAEYTGVLRAFEYIHKYFSEKSPHKIEVVADSLLIVRQLSGSYKIKNLGLKVLFDAIKILEFDLGEVFYRHVPRERNFIADRLANKALDEKGF